MNERIFQRDTVELDAAKVEHYTHDTFGPVTVFKDVPIARAIVQEYDDGKAYKPGKELWESAWTAEGRWAIAGRHPDTYLIMNRDDVHGRTVNARPTKSLKDASTRRPMDRGILVDLEIFDNLVSPQLLKDMVSGKKNNVSIGFSFDADKTPGIVEDEDDKSIMGAEYDYVQRNILIDHTAFGLEQGRCPMPLCGIGADEIKIAVDPFAGYETFEECVQDIMRQNPDYTREQAEGTCAVIEQRSKEKHKSDTEEGITMQTFNGKLDEILSILRPAEIEEDTAEDYPSTEYSHPLSCICRECGYTLQGSQGATLEKHCTEYKCPNCGAQMYRRNAPESGEELVQGGDSDWKELFDKLPEDVQSVIVDAGLCPDCSSDEEEDDELEEVETDDSDEPEEKTVEPKKKRDSKTPDEVMKKFDRTLDDPDLKHKLKELRV